MAAKILTRFAWGPYTRLSIPNLGIALTFALTFRAIRRLAMTVSSVQFYRRNLPHLQKDFTPHFVTFVTKFRLTLTPLARDIALASCCHDHGRRYELYAAVVMPDHVHLILTPLIDQQRREVFSLMRIMQAIKAASARSINQLLGHTGPVWQEESFDHVVRSSEGLEAKIEYVLRNPVRKGLVNDWREYPWTWKRDGRPLAEMQLINV